MGLTRENMMRALWAGLIAGIVWGWLAMGVNAVTGVFPFESTTLHNLSAFTIAGGLMGILSAALFLLARAFSPLKGVLFNAVTASVAVWLLFRGIGALLTAVDHMRFHAERAATAQGLLLAAVLGIFLAVVWSRRVKEL